MLAPTLKKPHISVALVILKTLISLFDYVLLGLELNSTGQRHSRTDVAYSCVRGSSFIYFFIKKEN